jgi:hypothetical protein
MLAVYKRIAGLSFVVDEYDVNGRKVRTFIVSGRKS